MAEKDVTIAVKIEQLEEILRWFESSEVTVEAAVKKYEQALKLSKELEAQLLTAQNQVEVIKQKFSV